MNDPMQPNDNARAQHAWNHVVVDQVRKLADGDPTEMVRISSEIILALGERAIEGTLRLPPDAELRQAVEARLLERQLNDGETQ